MNVEAVPPSPRSTRQRRSTLVRETGGAALPLVLAVLLTAFWTGIAWSDLAALRLPHADAMMRLASIRDWLDGQAFSDSVQSRLGPLGGTALPWSRLPELLPATIVRALSPLMGVTRAEIAAVIFWPELLLFAHLLLLGAMARQLSGVSAVPIALAVAALAYPAIDLFLPGRIDQHGLQIVLAEAVLLALLTRRLALAGFASAMSVTIGLETAPVLVAAMTWLAVLWVRQARPVASFGAGLLLAALLALALLRPQIWPADRCDGFTPPVLALLLMLGGFWLVLAGLTPRLPDLRWRAGAALLTGALVLAASWLAAPACFGNAYAPADAALMRIWSEGPTLGGRLVAELGLATSALAAALWLAWSARSEAATLALLAIAAAVISAAIDLRAAWIASALAAPVLAQLILATTRRGVAWQVGAWLASIGLLWQAVGDVALRTTPPEAACSDRRTLAALDRLDTGAFAAPLDLSAYLIGATQHRSLGGPSRRNLAGNRALAVLFRAAPGAAAYQASLWDVQYVALCPTSTGGLPAALRRPGSLGHHLLNGAAPDWLDAIPLVGSDLLVWRVEPMAASPIRP